jgi:hypothetical protein
VCFFFSNHAACKEYKAEYSLVKLDLTKKGKGKTHTAALALAIVDGPQLLAYW